MDTYLEPGEFNFICLSCNNGGQEYFTYTTFKGEVKEISDNYFIKCPFCNKKARVIGMPSVPVRLDGLGGVQAARINRYANDPDMLTKIQNEALDNNIRDVAISRTARMRKEAIKRNAAKNKAEWVKRGRKPEERMEAIKG